MPKKVKKRKSRNRSDKKAGKKGKTGAITANDFTNEVMKFYKGHPPLENLKSGKKNKKLITQEVRTQVTR